MSFAGPLVASTILQRPALAQNVVEDRDGVAIFELAEGGDKFGNSLPIIRLLFGRGHHLKGWLAVRCRWCLEAEEVAVGIRLEVPAAMEEVRAKIGNPHAVDPRVKPAPG